MAVGVSGSKPSSGAMADLPSERLKNTATNFNLDNSLSLQQLNRLLVEYNMQSTVLQVQKAWSKILKITMVIMEIINLNLTLHFSYFMASL
jgi:hypothetical protein